MIVFMIITFTPVVPLRHWQQRQASVSSDQPAVLHRFHSILLVVYSETTNSFGPDFHFVTFKTGHWA